MPRGQALFIHTTGGYRTPAQLQREYAAAARQYSVIPAADYFRSARAVPAQHFPRGYYEYERPHVDEEGPAPAEAAGGWGL